MKVLLELRKTVAAVVLFCLAVVGGAAAQEAAPDAHAPNQLDFSMFFLADVRKLAPVRNPCGERADRLWRRRHQSGDGLP